MRIFTTILIFFSSLFSFGQNKVAVKIHSMNDYSGFENFANAAAHKLETVLNSEKFRDTVLNEHFTKTNDLSNKEIYHKIMLAHEEQGEGGTDGTVDLRVRTISFALDGSKWMKNCEPDSRAGTYGIDGKGDGIMAICPQWLKIWYDTNDTAALAAHYAHEYMHILGFGHRGWFKKASLVYKIGDIVEALIKNGM